MIRVSLRSEDRAWSAKIGKIRWTKSKGKKSRFPDSTEADHAFGAAGELAFCRALGLPWPAHHETYHELPDVHPFWEIRTARQPRGLKGIKVVPEDPDYELSVWVSGKMPVFEILGYLRVGGVKRHPEWWGDPRKKKRPIWLAPPHKMIEINTGIHDVCHLLPARRVTTSILLPDATLATRWEPDDASDIWICMICEKRSVDEVVLEEDRPPVRG